ncbi:MAG: tetratricopeptide repeat protein, partial [Phycisphaerales bacterium]|nr:tetratricopeptide repeat protein [Phycisphaerales bacterium]
AMPTAVGPRRWAAEQVLAVRAESPAAYLREALAELRAEMQIAPRGAAATMAVSVLRELAAVTGETRHLDEAITLAEELVAADPQGLSAHRRLGDLLWDAERHADAAAVYRRALEIDDDSAFDPLKQLSAGERSRLESRVADAG